jgi:hypothetical protein
LGDEFILFEGELNFNTYKNHFGKVSLSVERKDFNDLLQTRFDTKVSMKATETLDGEPLIAPQPFDIGLHSKQFLKNYTNVIATTARTEYVPYVETNVFYYQLNTIGPQLSEIEENFPYPLGYTLSNPITTDLYNWKMLFASNFQLSIEDTLQIDIQRFGVFLSASAYTLTPYFKMVRAGSEIISEVIGPVLSGTWSEDFGGVQLLSFSVPISYAATLDLQKDDQLYFYVKYETAVVEKHQTRLSSAGTNITAVALENATTSSSKMWLLFDVINHLIKVATNNEGSLKSNLLTPKNNTVAKDGEFSLYAITNGFNIRNFDIDEKPLNLSLKTALNSTKAIASIGMGFEKRGVLEQVRVEKVEFFYQQREILVIAPEYDAKGIEAYDEEVAKEFIWNEVETGYNKYKEDGYNTLDEFNTKHEYLTPIKTHKAKLTLKSDFIASGYSLEDSRRQQYANTPTNSYSNDDDPFIVSLRRSDTLFVAEKDEAFENVTGVISPSTAYNLRISPLRMLLNWGKWLSGSFAFKDGSELIKNTFVDKNGLLVTDFLDSEPNPMGDINKTEWQENQAVAIDDLGGSIHRPEWVNVKCRLTPDKVLLINEALRGGYGPTKDYGYITVKNPEGDFIAMWPYKLTYNFATKRCEIKGLKCFDNPVDPLAECCNWLNINGCLVLMNGERVITR